MTDKTQEEQRTLFTELNKVLSDRTNDAISARITLRDAVCAYVAAERVRGAGLKNVIQTVKDILRKAEQEAAGASDEPERRDKELAQQLVDWCMEFHRTARIAVA